MTQTRFPEHHPFAVHLPESFRGGCSFGVGSQKAALSRKVHLDVNQMIEGHDKVSTAPQDLSLY